ncbi:hypothetical protein CYLTODRAFT_477178, partial [Cylindrobasidium torrendii FP15055 ss-10]
LDRRGGLHRDGIRGRHGSARKGVNHGGGTKQPCQIKVGTNAGRVLDELFDSDSFKADIEMGDHHFRTFNPALYQEYLDVKEYYTQNKATSHLKWNFTNSVYAATTVNFGPRTQTLDHVDSANFAPGWCRVRAYGPYNPKKGGHLVFWDLGIAIEFPPGASIFFPSALLVHSNLAIGEDEERYSVTSYSAGGLFRWKYNGGIPNEELEERLRETGNWADERKARAGRFKLYVDRFFPKYK